MKKTLHTMEKSKNDFSFIFMMPLCGVMEEIMEAKKKILIVEDEQKYDKHLMCL